MAHSAHTEVTSPVVVTAKNADHLKFSELQLLDDNKQPFSNIYGATSSAVLTEFFSLHEIIETSEEDLLRFLAEKKQKSYQRYIKNL
jgi:hypothetical protein